MFLSWFWCKKFYCKTAVCEVQFLCYKFLVFIEFFWKQRKILIPKFLEAQFLREFKSQLVVN